MNGPGGGPPPTGERGSPAGLFPVCKPPGMTSHDVVDVVRRLARERHAGHTGTLDPGAAGVLCVLVGEGATRLSEYFLDLEKVYVAEVRFGRTTDTQDATGRTTGLCPAQTLARLDRTAVEAALPRFTGAIEQVPPMVSAVQVGGERLYELARRGRDVRRRPRKVFIYELCLLDFVPDRAGQSPPTARLRVACSRGTYVRTLAHDLGAALGVGAHMGFLVREAVGPFRLEASFSLEELAAAASRGELGSLAVPPAAAVGHFPAVRLGAREAIRLRSGESVPAAVVAVPAAGMGAAAPPRASGPASDGEGLWRVLDENGELVAIASLVGGRLRPRKVLKPWMGGAGA